MLFGGKENETAFNVTVRHQTHLHVALFVFSWLASPYIFLSGCISLENRQLKERLEPIFTAMSKGRLQTSHSLVSKR
jgi:hypothetical protein